MNSETRTIGIYVFDGVEELDAVGPWEVLAAWTRGWPEDGWRVVTFATKPGAIKCAKGLEIVAEYSFETAPPLDVLVHPGGQGTRAQLDDTAHLEWLRARAAAGTLMTSVCTGSLVFAAAGLLHHRPATSHWSSLEQLADLDQTIEVRGQDRFVDDGEIVTAAGVSAGIDMALHLVDRLAGTAREREVRRYIQYDPQPPI